MSISLGLVSEGREARDETREERGKEEKNEITKQHPFFIHAAFRGRTRLASYTAYLANHTGLP